MGVSWGLIMPMPKTTILTNQPVRGGIVVGLTLGALSPVLTLLLAVLWCAVRLWRGKALEVAATAMCAALLPTLFLATQLRQVAHSAGGMEITFEVMALGLLALAGFLRWQFSAEDEDEEDEEQDEEAGPEAAVTEAAEAAQS